MSDTLLSGKIPNQLIKLTGPLVVGNILQQLYNAVDSIIIERHLGQTAFAAAGVAGSVMNLFIFVLSGCCVGISIIFAQLYGASDYQGFRKESFIATALGGGFTLLLSATAILFLPALLQLIRTPADVAAHATDYLRVIFIGFLATYAYNLCAAALRSVGNTGISLLFLCVAAITNTVLDFVFIAWLHMGIAGAAWATVISQLLSAVLSFLYISKHMPFAIFSKRDMRFDRSLIVKTTKFSLVSALHQSSLYIGKLLVQGAVNTLGTTYISSFTAAMRVEGFATSFSTSGAEAVSVFVAQNTGNHNKKRALQGFYYGIGMLSLFGAVLAVILYFAAPYCLAFFVGSDHPLEIQYGCAYTKTLAFFYIMCFTANSFVGYFRGTGNVNIPVIGTTMQIAVRVLLSYLLIGQLQLKGVAFATCAGWILLAFYQTAMFFWIRRKQALENRALT